MQVYVPETEVRTPFDLLDPAGVALAPTSLHYRVTDQDGAEVVPLTAIEDLEVTPVSVVTPADSNVIAAGRVREMRVVELQVMTATGAVRFYSEYVIEAREALVENVNSFQSLEQATLIAFDIPNLPGWAGAARPERIAALTQARHHISRLRFRYSHDRRQEYLSESYPVNDLLDLTVSEWAALPADFKTALRRAQVIEADALLGGDELADMRAAGLLSKTTGESSASFRASVKPIDRPVCPRAMKELGKFVRLAIRVGRV